MSSGFTDSAMGDAHYFDPHGIIVFVPPNRPQNPEILARIREALERYRAPFQILPDWAPPVDVPAPSYSEHPRTPPSCGTQEMPYTVLIDTAAVYPNESWAPPEDASRYGADAFVAFTLISCVPGNATEARHWDRRVYFGRDLNHLYLAAYHRATVLPPGGRNGWQNSYRIIPAPWIDYTAWNYSYQFLARTQCPECWGPLPSLAPDTLWQIREGLRSDQPTLINIWCPDCNTRRTFWVQWQSFLEAFNGAFASGW